MKTATLIKILKPQAKLIGLGEKKKKESKPQPTCILEDNKPEPTGFESTFGILTLA